MRTKRIKKNIRRNKKKTRKTKKQKGVFGKKMQCHPSNKSGSRSCLSNDQVNSLKNNWNNNNSDKINSSSNSKEILNQLGEKTSCKNELCVVEKVNPSLKGVFAPKAPEEWKKDINTWLTNIDINKVMNQYEQTYKCFEFIGPSPIDFDTMNNGKCVWDELCNFDLSNHIQNGKKKIGIIFNTDTHDGDGEHWISLFINIQRSMIFFFDSVGSPAPNEVKQFVDRVIEQGNKLDSPVHFIFDQNHPIEHQYKNTECGIYSLFFIIHMLEDKINGEYLKTHILKDKYIEKYRKIFFNVV